MRSTPQLLFAAITLLSLLAGPPSVHAQSVEMEQQAEQIQQMIDIITEASRALDSQLTLSATTAALPEPKPQRGLTGISLGASASLSDPEENPDELLFSRGASLSLSFSLRDPSWPINRANLSRAQTEAIREQEAVRAELVDRLFATLDSLAELRREEAEYEALTTELETRVEQIRANRVVVSLDQQWEIEERLLTLKTSLSATRAAIERYQLRAALEQGGERWSELLDLLRDWGTQATL